MMNEQTDLIRRSVAGDQEALEVLLDRFGPIVRSRLHVPARFRSILSEDDVMQETYIDVFLDIYQFDPARSAAFAAWIGVIAERNLKSAIKMHLARKRGGDHGRIEPRGDEDGLSGMFDRVFGATTSTPSRFLGRAEALTAMRRAIDELPEDHRRIVEEVDLRERRVEDVARELGLTVGATYMRRARAHRMIGRKVGRMSRFVSSA